MQSEFEFGCSLTPPTGTLFSMLCLTFQVANDIVNIEAVRFNLKTPFDRNVVTQFETQVSCSTIIKIELSLPQILTSDS